MILAQTSVETAAIEALKQAPGLVITLVVVVLFLRYIEGRGRADAEERKNNAEERRQMLSTLDKFSTTQQNLAVVVEGLKENMKHVGK